MGLAWERKGGNHKDKQQLRLGVKRVAAGACIIVEKYECRRIFFKFFFSFFLSFFVWAIYFFGSQGQQRKIRGTNAKNASFGSAIDRSSRSFLRWFQGQGRWGMKAMGNEGDREWGKCRRLFLSVSL